MVIFTGGVCYMVTIPINMKIGEFFKIKAQLKASINLGATCMICSRFVPAKHTL